ncbi:outer membrane protein assembly factor BamE [Sphingomonas humi]|uniref:Outer membrane protein assembly factor BamE n=1 Tax=Sphingomonas humi TaxID=335630 RepID=A0ABP7RL76_9SPHN
MNRIVFFVSIAALGLGGCAGYRESRGFIMDEQLAQAVQVGTDNKTSVEKTLGRPTYTGQFSDNEWYYVSRQTSTFAFRAPKVTEQQILRIKFDQGGNVSAIERTGKEKIASIDPYGKTTPTLGRKKSFFEEFFGNIGTVGGVGPTSGGQPGQ